MRFADALEVSWKAQVERIPWLKRLTGLMARLRARTLPLRGARRGETQVGLRIEDRLFLGPKRMLAVVSYRGEEFLVAAGAETITSVMPLGVARRAEPSVSTEESKSKPAAALAKERARRTTKPEPKVVSKPVASKRKVRGGGKARSAALESRKAAANDPQTPRAVPGATTLTNKTKQSRKRASREISPAALSELASTAAAPLAGRLQ